MIITFQYRIKPTPEQVSIMEAWSELLRRHWNFALGQRLNWLNRTRCQIDRCSIVSEPVGEIPKPVDYYYQQSALKETKKLFPEYANIYSEVQQMNLQRLDKAWKRWLVPDKTGNRGGRPKFKKRGEKPSFSFSRVNHPKAACFLEGSILRIPKIGLIPIILVKVNPHNTTQNCSGCGTKVRKTLSVRLHECPKCSLEMDRDENAAINILYKALDAVGLTATACGALDDGQAMKQELLEATLEAHVTAQA